MSMLATTPPLRVCAQQTLLRSATTTLLPAASTVLLQRRTLFNLSKPRRAPASPAVAHTSTALAPSEEHSLVERKSAACNLLKLRQPYTDTFAHFPHPVYTEEQMRSIQIAHRTAKNWSDWAALTAVRLLRWSFDTATGYRHHDSKSSIFKMTEEKWLTRFIFLESIAGVPGMVGGMVRHLHSLRLLRADKGWIETLLEESQNERMHLLTFLAYRQPGLFMRAMILAGQGVFTNLFFMCYLISPRTCHRFVGYLEEEAVITYTRAISDLEGGKLEKWRDLKAPEIAKKYFNLEDGKDMMKELLECIRADEAKHREVNHTLANLDQHVDANPFVQTWEGKGPGKGLETVKSTGWEREEVVPIVEGSDIEKKA